MPSSSSLPTWWLRLWIAIGVVVFALIIIVPAFIFTTFTSERHRFEGCEQKTRSDCRPSMIWLFAGWLQPVPQPLTVTSTGSIVPTSTTATVPSDAPPLGNAREEHVGATSTRITSVKAEGILLVGGKYQIGPSTSTVWTVKADDAQTVEVYLKVPGAASKRVVSLKKQKDGSFQGGWNIPKALGELEVRALGAKNARHSLFFGVASSQ